MLIVCIRFLRVCSAYAANSDAYAQHVLKEPFKFWIFMLMLSIRVLNWAYASESDAFSEHTGQILTHMLSIHNRFWRLCSGHASNFDPYAQHTHQILTRMLSGCIKLWRVCSAYASNSDAYAQNVLKGSFEIIMRMLSVRIKFWCTCSVYASNSDTYHRGMSLIGESVLVKYLLFRLSELNRIKEFHMYITVLICEEWKSCKIACRWAARVA